MIETIYLNDNVEIVIYPQKHLIITGVNGSGKTKLLTAIENSLCKHDYLYCSEYRTIKIEGIISKLLEKYGLRTSKKGIVFIDFIEKSLDVSMQKTILPLLIGLFPNLQFIVTTHSPIITSSIKDAVVYDLGTNILLENPGLYSYKSILEDYFGNHQYSHYIVNKINRYEFLNSKKDLTDNEKEEKKEILQYLVGLNGENTISKFKKLFS